MVETHNLQWTIQLNDSAGIGFVLIGFHSLETNRSLCPVTAVVHIPSRSTSKGPAAVVVSS